MTSTASGDEMVQRNASLAGPAPGPGRRAAPRADGRDGERGEMPTLADTWLATAGTPITDALLEWPPDVFALANVILRQAQAFRFALSPPASQQWPPARAVDWGDAVEQAAQQWRIWAEDRVGAVPELVAREWAVAAGRAGLPLQQLAQGQDWRLAEALLTLHAIADEACAGLSVAFGYGDGHAGRYRARSRELLARTGSLARIPASFLRVLPKAQTPPTGRASFSRYACVVRSGVQVGWHKLPFRTSGTGPQAEIGNLLLLPWPLRVRAADFRVVAGSVQRMAAEPFGFFEFAPREPLDLDLLDRVLAAAREEVGSVDIVMLPESAVDVGQIADIEGLLDAHGVASLRVGVRGHSQPGAMGANWMHIGVNPRLDASSPLAAGAAAGWFHLRQNKHHRWSLDESQIYQYHLGAVLHPRIRWYEAMDTPAPSVQFMEAGAGTLTANIICEDLTQNDEVAEVIRSVGPTFMTAFLLDGPQLATRWSARYASVLADDPGAAVLTLTSYGMVARSRPPGFSPSTVVALWKDPDRGAREIALEPGADAVLLSVAGDAATRRSADGRWPARTGTSIFDAAVHQIRAAPAGTSARTTHPPAKPGPPALDIEELTTLTGWAEGVAEMLAYAPGQLTALLADARAGARWRHSLALPEPSPRVGQAIDVIQQTIDTATRPQSTPTLDAVLTALQIQQPGGPALHQLAQRILRSTLDQLRSRQDRIAQPPHPT